MYRTVEDLRRIKRTAGFAAELGKDQRAALLQQPEALLAALLSQLHRRDTVLVEGGTQLLQASMGKWFTPGTEPRLHSVPGSSAQCASIAAGMALRIADWARPATTKHGSSDLPQPVIVALLRSFPADPTLFALLHRHDLSVVLLVESEPQTRADAQARLTATPVPLMPVDSSDAVALCRVTQECLLRARNGWGSAIIQVTAMPNSGDPLALLARHMQTRSLTA